MSGRRPSGDVIAVRSRITVVVQLAVVAAGLSRQVAA